VETGVSDAGERWWALIGPALFLEPSGFISTPHDSWRALDRSYELGELRLDPGDRKLEDYIHLIAKGWSRKLSWPIIVSGDAAGVWPSVARSAARSVHRLCCLWSLAWAEPWQVRLAPQLVSYYPPEVPEPVLVPNADWLTNLDNDPENHKDPQPLPAWLPGAWDRLNDDAFGSRVDPAVSLWHEGILLQSEHPSMAMVAYIAVVEQLAEPVLDSDGRRSSRQSFWKAVEAVASPEDILALRQADAYGKRSATAHGGALHGIELEFGHMLLQPIGPGDPTYDFMFDSLQRMKLASRAVLLAAIA
jgi:hypothetical protein